MAPLQVIRRSPTKAEREAAANSPGADLIGDLLRRQREALGLDISTVGQVLKIKTAYLAALEAGRLEQLPAPVYAIGFLRAYAGHLRLDADELVRRFKQYPASFGRTPDLAFPMPFGERGTPGGGMLLVAAILAICGYGTWFSCRSTDELSRPARVAEVPAELLPPTPQAPLARPAEAQAVTPISTRDAPEPDETPKATAEPTASSATRPSPSPLTAVGAAAAAPQTAALAPASPLQDASVAIGATARIVLHAVADSWVEIRDADQGVLLARILKVGESYEVPDRPGLSMRTGNAGGLAITVDGNPVPSVGPVGAVRRNVVLQPEALSAATVVRP